MSLELASMFLIECLYKPERKAATQTSSQSVAHWPTRKLKTRTLDVLAIALRERNESK